jgi:hypothetical protein
MRRCGSSMAAPRLAEAAIEDLQFIYVYGRASPRPVSRSVFIDFPFDRYKLGWLERRGPYGRALSGIPQISDDDSQE